MKSLIEFLSKYQHWLLGIAAFFALSAVSFRYTNGQSTITLKDYPVLMFLLVVLSIMIILVYVQISKRKIKALTDQVSAYAKEPTDDFQKRILDLTPQQKKVCDLIVAGRSNKEIMAELFIEKSTLKSHINQMYRKLDLKNRKELRTKLPRENQG